MKIQMHISAHAIIAVKITTIVFVGVLLGAVASTRITPPPGIILLEYGQRIDKLEQDVTQTKSDIKTLKETQ